MCHLIQLDQDKSMFKTFRYNFIFATGHGRDLAELRISFLAISRYSRLKFKCLPFFMYLFLRLGIVFYNKRETYFCYLTQNMNSSSTIHEYFAVF